MAEEKKSGIRMVRDMVVSVTVVTLAAGVIYLFIPNDASQTPVQRENYQVELKTASRAAPYPVVAPRGLPGEWRATSVRYEGDEGAAWHLGFLTPDDEYAAVEQSSRGPAGFVSDVTFGAKDTGRTVRLDGEEWARYEGEKYDALVRAEPEVTTVVTGTAPFGRLRELAGALEAGAPQNAKG